MSLKGKIRDAQALAEFANLTPEKLARFRQLESDFVPRDWWDYQPTNERGKPSAPWPPALSEGGTKQWKQWELNQGWLLEAWSKKFEIDQFVFIRLLLSVFDPDQVLWSPAVHPHPPFADLTMMPDTMYPYQRAVIFLMEQRWRARLCARCNCPFAATHNQQKYCSQERGAENETCFALARKGQKRQDHSKHRKARNSKRRVEYAIKRKRESQRARRGGNIR
jgi:hypothetical protein